MSTTTPTNGTPQAAAPGDGSSAAGAAHDGVHDWRHEDPDPNPDQLDHLVMGRHQNGSTGPTTRLSPPLPTPPRLKRRGSGNAVVLPAVTIDTGSSARISLPPSNGSRSNSGSEANSPITPSSLLTPDGKYRGGRHRQRSSTVTGQQQPLGSPRATVTTTTPPLPLMTDIASRLALLATNEEDEAAATGASLATRNAGMTPPRQRKGTSSSEHGAASAAISAATSSSTATSVSYTEDTPSSPSTPSSPFQRTLFMARKQGPSGERRRSMVASIPGSPVYPPHDADHSARAPPSPREAATNGSNSLGLIAAAVLSAAAVSAGTGATHQVVQSSPKPSQRSYQRSTSTVQMNHQAAADAASTDAAGATPYGSPTKPTMGSPKLTRYADKPLPPIPSHPPQRFRSPSANDANLPVRTRSLSATPSGDRAKSEDLARPPISPISPNTATASGGSSSLAAAMKAYRTIRSRVTQPLLKPATNGPGERPHEESHPAPGAAVEEDVERKKMFTPLKKLIRKSASGKNIKGLDIATNEEAPKPPPAPPLSPSIATTSTVSLASSMAPSVTASSPTVGKRRDSLINSMFASSAKRTISLEPLPEPDEPKTEMSTSLSLPAILESSLDDEKIAMLIEAASFLDRAEAEALLVECSWNVDVATDKANRRHKHDDEGDSTFDKARGKLAKFLTKRKSAYGSSAAASLYATVRNPLVVAGKFSSPAVPITAAQQPPRQWFDEEHVSSSDDDVEGQNNRSARKSRKRRFIVDEIVRTEETHCQQMKYIYQSIVLELRRSSRLTDPIMPAEEIDAIFSTFEEMLTIHADLLLALQPKLASWADDTCLAPLFIKLFENPKPFEDFGDNFVKGKDRFQSHVRQSPKLQALLEKFFEDSRVRVHSVVEILRLPLQRVPRYRELLRELSLYTSPGHPDYNDMQDVIKQVELVHNKIQSLTIKEDSIKAMYLVQQNIIGCPSTIINSERYVMYELDAIELHVETNKIKQIVRIVLFNDLLLLATKVDRRRGLFMELFTTTLHGFSKDSEAQYRLDGLFPLQDVGLLDSSTDTYLNGLGSFLVLWVNDSARMFQATTTANFKHFLPQLKETLQKFPMAAETKERLNVFQSGEHTAVIASNGGDHDEEPSLERTRRMSLNPMASRRGRLRTKSDSKRGDRPNLDSLLENLSSALKPTAPVPSVPIRQPTGDEKLEDFLQDSEGLEVFSAFLKGEYSSENVEFWLAVERFREIGDADRIKAAELIMKLFIRPNGDQEVNIKYQLKDNLIHQFEAGEVEATMFDTTQKDIFALMATDSFPRFLRSKFFQEFHPAAKQRDSISGTSPRSASSFDI